MLVAHVVREGAFPGRNRHAPPTASWLAKSASQTRSTSHAREPRRARATTDTRPSAGPTRSSPPRRVRVQHDIASAAYTLCMQHANPLSYQSFQHSLWSRSDAGFSLSGTRYDGASLRRSGRSSPSSSSRSYRSSRPSRVVAQSSSASVSPRSNFSEGESALWSSWSSTFRPSSPGSPDPG